MSCFHMYPGITLATRLAQNAHQEMMHSFLWRFIRKKQKNSRTAREPNWRYTHHLGTNTPPRAGPVTPPMQTDWTPGVESSALIMLGVSINQ